MLQNNRNKQKTNRNSSKFVKIKTFLFPHTISSVCFGCCDTGPKHRNKPKINFSFAKKTDMQPKQIEFRFVSVRTPRKKINCFENPLIENISWRFFRCLFRFVSTKFRLFLLFDTDPKHRNKPKKMLFGFAKQTENKN